MEHFSCYLYAHDNDDDAVSQGYKTCFSDIKHDHRVP